MLFKKKKLESGYIHTKRFVMFNIKWIYIASMFLLIFKYKFLLGI